MQNKDEELNRNLFLHVDGDSFFVSCELSVHTELKGLPVVVGEDRGIAVAMNPEAKKLGVTRGMPTFKIKQLYPQVVILSHHFDLYKEIADNLKKIILKYTVIVEEYSIDECFALVDPSEIKYFGGEKEFLAALKKEIEKKLGVTYSLGLAHTKALAKQASKLEKPNGSVILLSKEDEINALKKTPIDDIWGIGWRTMPTMRRLGLETAYDFAIFPKLYSEQKFSRPILDLQRELLGESVFKVHSDVDPRDQKSIQSTCTFRPASDDPKIIWRELAENTEDACRHARALELVANKISFFIKTTEFKYYSEEVKLSIYTSDPGCVLGSIESLLPRMLLKKDRIRATGITLHGLIREENVPQDLFGKQDKILKELSIEKTADKIRAKFGSEAIKRASSIKKKNA